ncbi:MAG: hypothetical protein K6B74_09905 [Ruminococcus sp.]|nr:hypothetical protein [Ruminococcus sp.]
MNGNDILRAMNGLDEKYIISANGEQTLKQGRKPAKSIFKTAVAIAAAAALMIPVGAYAYTRLIHRESVEMYLENSAKVEESGNAVNRVMENEHIRITLDTVLSDGYMAMAIVTLDALDEYGRNFVLTHPDIMLKRTDTGEPVFPSGGGGMNDHIGQRKNDSIKYYHTFDLKKIDSAPDYEMIFYSYGLFTDEDHAAANGKSFKVDENFIPLDNPLGYDFVANVNFRRNVDAVTLTAENGNTLTLSQFELISEDPALDLINVSPDTFRLIKNDGTLEERTDFSGFGSGEEDDEQFSALCFGKFIDLDEYKGVMLDGTEYLK